MGQKVESTWIESLFHLEGIEAFVTRCVSEGYQAISLAYAAGYEELTLAHGEKEKSPSVVSVGVDLFGTKGDYRLLKRRLRVFFLAIWGLGNPMRKRGKPIGRPSGRGLSPGGRAECGGVVA